MDLNTAWNTAVLHRADMEKCDIMQVCKQFWITSSSSHISHCRGCEKCERTYCHLGWRTLVLKCNKNNYDWENQERQVQLFLGRSERENTILEIGNHGWSIFGGHPEQYVGSAGTCPSGSDCLSDVLVAGLLRVYCDESVLNLSLGNKCLLYSKCHKFPWALTYVSMFVCTWRAQCSLVTVSRRRKTLWAGLTLSLPPRSRRWANVSQPWQLWQVSIILKNGSMVKVVRFVALKTNCLPKQHAAEFYLHPEPRTCTRPDGQDRGSERVFWGAILKFTDVSDHWLGTWSDANMISLAGDWQCCGWSTHV